MLQVFYVLRFINTVAITYHFFLKIEGLQRSHTLLTDPLGVTASWDLAQGRYAPLARKWRRI